MNVDIYYSGKRSSTKFLVVPAGTSVSDMIFPHDPDLQHHDVNGLKLFKCDVPADVIGGTPDDVASQIQAKGYAVCSSVAGSEKTKN
ncbi:hypothetical protein [Methylobacterium iners]|uniref:Uncharacterized protein n=1 Tax=Methylobacterium iners TaxID=418707 RepID=A0ABQ4S348_9HYPH|nr:hypothetical protein [Methylobacterium iners]GJD97306.1 hypothetical protein OCOJLMKI_4535 [Methylobacterium iners]